MNRQKQIEAAANLEHFDFHGCLTGDCPHEKQVDCLNHAYNMGAQWADAHTPPIPADVEYLTKQLEIADGNLADCERNLEESIADDDKANERITALETLTKQMADCLENHGLRSAIWFLEGPYFEPPCKEAADEIRKMLDAYKRGVGK